MQPVPPLQGHSLLKASDCYFNHTVSRANDSTMRAASRVTSTLDCRSRVQVQLKVAGTVVWVIDLPLMNDDELADALQWTSDQEVDRVFVSSNGYCK